MCQQLVLVKDAVASSLMVWMAWAGWFRCDPTRSDVGALSLAQSMSSLYYVEEFRNCHVLFLVSQRETERAGKLWMVVQGA